MKTAVFIDVSNLYFTLRSKYQQQVDYRKLVNYCNTFGEVTEIVAYGVNRHGDANGFVNWLEKTLKVVTRFKQPKEYHHGEGVILKGNWDVGMTVDIIDRVLQNKIERVILCSADGDFADLVKFIQKQGITVVIIGCRISNDLRAVADTAVEIPMSMLGSTHRPRQTKESVNETFAHA